MSQPSPQSSKPDASEKPPEGTQNIQADAPTQNDGASHSPATPPSVVSGASSPSVLGDYVILARLGHGGMGQVYKARHRRMERIVALKTLPDVLAHDAHALARFHREVQAAARLSHPNIVTAYDAREDNGTHYLVMEYVPGDDLGKYVREHGPMSALVAAQCILQAARGLEYAHHRGVIHRDVKPSNLILQRDTGGGEAERSPGGSQLNAPLVVKVLDMGLARIDHPDGDPNVLANDLTATGAVMGTVDYMAPEQAQNTHNADQRSDIYSLGMTLYYLVTSKAAYTGSTMMERLLAHREQPIPSLEVPLKADRHDSELPASGDHLRRLNEVFQRMVAKAPGARYQSMTQLIADLEPLAAEMGREAGAANTSANAPGSMPSRPSPVDETHSPATVMPAIPAPSDTSRSFERARIVQVTPRADLSDPPRLHWGRWVALGLVLVGAVAAGIIYRINTDHGTIVVEIEDDTIAAVLTTSGLEVVDRNDPDKKWTINLAETGEAITEGIPSGEYELPNIPGVELHITDSGGAEYSAREFKLNRGDEVRIRITAEPFEPGEPEAGSQPTLVDYAKEREVAEWVLSIGGTVRVVVGAGAERIVSEAPLPGEPFQVVRIDLVANAGYSNGDLARLQSLSSLRHVNLNDCTQISDAGVLTLAQIPSLEGMNLHHTAITDAALAEVARLPSLRELHLAHTDVTDQGLMELAACVHLESLGLLSVPITIEGLRALRDVPLNYLIINHTQLRYSDLPEIVALFPGLHRFDGYRLQGDVREGLSPLAQLPDLETLAIDADFVTAGPPHHLDQFPRLRQIEMYYESFPPGLVSRLEQLPRVTELLVDSPTFEAGAFAELCANPTLERLELRFWSGGDAELLELSAMSNLRELVLQGTQVTATGAQAFHEQRPDVTITGDFNIPAESGPNETDYAHEREVAEWVLSVGGFVVLAGPDLVEQTCREMPLPEQPFHLTKISFRGVPTVADADLLRFESLTHLYHLSLIFCDGITDTGAETIAGMSTLRQVVLPGTSVTDVGLAQIAQLPELRHLTLDVTLVTDSGLMLLADAHNLEELSLGSLPISMETLRALRTLPLKRLAVFDTPIRYADLPELVTLFPLLEKFDGRGLQGEVGTGLSPLAELAHLVQLNVEARDITAGPPHHLARFESLRSLYMYATDFPIGVAGELESLPGITELYLIGPRFAEGAFDELCGNTTLARLEIEEWPGSDVEILQLTGMANLRRLRIRGSNWTAAGAQAFHEQRPDVAIYGDFTIPAETDTQGQPENQ